MIAKRLKIDPLKTRCDRCQETKPPIHECRFSFPEGFRHWKAIWQQKMGRRLTNRRKQKLLEQEEPLDLRELSKVAYWMDLCEGCWQECRAASCPGFPMDFWEAVLQKKRA